MVREQGVGDDETEHRVTEELEALVVGHLPVLVRVRAVREGVLEQLRIEIGDPEQMEQLAGQRT
jgi:hypothetical protein